MSSSKVVRIRSEGILGGVCAGLGAYLRIDPVFVRIFFVLLAFSGVGVIAYFMLWLLLPDESSQEGQAFDVTVSENAKEIAGRAHKIGSELPQGLEGLNPQLPVIIGGVLIIMGFAFLIENLHIAWLSWLRYEFLWPTLLILGGVVLLLRRAQGE